MDINYEIIGKNIIKYRTQNNMTQKALSDEIGISSDSLSKIERALPKLKPSITTLAKVALVLHINIDDLLSDNLNYKSIQNGVNKNIENLSAELYHKSTKQKEMILEFLLKYLQILGK